MAASAAVDLKRKRGATGERCDNEEVTVDCARRLGSGCDDFTTLDRSYDDVEQCVRCGAAGERGRREGGLGRAKGGRGR